MVLFLSADMENPVLFGDRAEVDSDVQSRAVAGLMTMQASGQRTIERKTVQFSRLAMRLSHVNLFDMAKDDFAHDINKRGLKFSEIHWHEPMESRYQCEPFEYISQVTFYAEVRPA